MNATLATSASSAKHRATGVSFPGSSNQSERRRGGRGRGDRASEQENTTEHTGPEQASSLSLACRAHRPPLCPLWCSQHRDRAGPQPRPPVGLLADGRPHRALRSARGGGGHGAGGRGARCGGGRGGRRAGGAGCLMICGSCCEVLTLCTLSRTRLARLALTSAPRRCSRLVRVSRRLVRIGSRADWGAWRCLALSAPIGKQHKQCCLCLVSVFIYEHSQKALWSPRPPRQMMFYARVCIAKRQRVVSAVLRRAVTSLEMS